MRKQGERRRRRSRRDKWEGEGEGKGGRGRERRKEKEKKRRRQISFLFSFLFFFSFVFLSQVPIPSPEGGTVRDSTNVQIVSISNRRHNLHLGRDGGEREGNGELISWRRKKKVKRNLKKKEEKTCSRCGGR